MVWLIVLLVFVVHGMVLSFFVLLEHREPTATLAWILALVLIPFVGALAYYLFGRVRFVRRRRKRALHIGPVSQRMEALARPAADEEDLHLPWWEADTAELLSLKPYAHLSSLRREREAESGEDVGSLLVMGEEALGAAPEVKEREGAEEQEGSSSSSDWRSPSFLEPDLSSSSGMAPPSSSGGTSDERLKAMWEVQSRSLARLAHRVSGAMVSPHNSMALLKDGPASFAAKEEAILAAREHIHVCYYIFRADKTGRWLRDLLVQRAKEGIEVRLLVDALGSAALPEDFWQPLRAVGGKVAAFFPLRFSSGRGSSQVNFRNHRKIIVVDGVVGFTGGLNIGDEYQGEAAGRQHWRDTHLVIRGPAVRDLQMTFGEDWFDATEEPLDELSYFPKVEAEPDGGRAQIIPSGPDQPWESLHLIFFSAIVMAQRRVWITTPYFVPNGAMMTALKTTALRGVDVRLLLPEHSDERLVWYAGRSYYRDLLRAGVRIHEYTPGILHAKTLSVDGIFSTIGSANMDIRSFQLNFELNVLSYDPALAQEMEAMFLDDLTHANEIELMTFLRRPLRQRLLESGARLLSPLL